jgi:AAA family ATP:ADP antiporter
MTMAFICAATVTAQFVAAKATRDALFLSSLGAAALPTMLIATSACAILLATMYARLSGRLSPALLVPTAFCASGALFIVEWFVRAQAPRPAAVLLYLHISAAAPLLASGFWLIVSERFSPRTAKKGFGRLAGAGTLGGLLGALVAERVASASAVHLMLPILAAFQLLAAALVRILARNAAPFSTALAEPAGAPPQLPRSSLRILAESRRLRHLMALVLLGTTSAALLDYVFKVRAAETFGFGDTLLRFFAFYYAGTSLVAFVLQVGASRAMLERFGVALTTSTPSIALLAGCAGALAAPGFGSILVARGAESIFRGSWFRSGYELFYTPVPPAEKRAAKSLIDVAFDRLGEAMGGGLVRIATLLAPAMQTPVILGTAMAGSIGAILAASHLNRWYLRALESSLLDRAGAIDLSEPGDGSTRRVLASVPRDTAPSADAKTDMPTTRTPPVVVNSPEVQDVLTLQSGTFHEAIKVLFREDRLPAGLISHVIPMLAREPVADFALFALRKVAEERVGQLTDALLDPNQDYAVRRRLARVFSVCVSQRATDALVLALDDPRFDVRFQAARSLAAIVDKNPRVRIEAKQIYDAALRELAVGRPVWESRRLLDGVTGDSPLDEFVRDRSDESLAHVFTLLSLVLPREPLQIAFRSLHSADEHLRGTALEYLEGVLPSAIRQRLWPFVVRRPSRVPVQSYDEVMGNLLRSSHSVTLHGLAAPGRTPLPPDMLNDPRPFVSAMS